MQTANLVYRNERKLFAVAVFVSTLVWLAIVAATLGIALLWILIAFLVYLFAHSAFIAHLKGNGVRVSTTQFPDLHRSLHECCRRLGIESAPEMYLLRTDFFNALATRFLGRNLIVLFSDVVDALQESPGAVDFYIGHELGHIHRKHLKWSAYLFPASLLPVLGSALRRAQEYTCDRYGAACCRTEEDVKAALAAISAGDTRWKTLSASDYLEQIPATAGFWMSFHELTGDYPWLTKRMASALAFFRGDELRHPRRSFLAGLLALFVPRFGGLGGGASLILALAVLGVLAALAVPAYQDYAVRAQVTEALEMAREIRPAIEDYAIENDLWPESLLELGYESDVLTTPNGGLEIAIYEDGIIGIRLGLDAAGEPQYLVVEPYLEDDVIEWTCYGQNAEPRHLPSACR